MFAVSARHRPAVRDRRERGAVAVEFALILPLLAMLLLGTITAGLAYSHGLGLTNGVREGARFAATTKYPAATGNWANDVLTRTRQLQFDDPSSETKICVDLYKQGTGFLVQQCNGVSTTPAASPPVLTVPAGTATGSCLVRVWAARPFSVNTVIVNFSGKLMSRQSVAVYERPPC